MYVYVEHTSELVCAKCGEVVALKSQPRRPSLSRVVKGDGTPLQVRGGSEPLPYLFQVKCACGASLPLRLMENCMAQTFASDPDIPGGTVEVLESE